MMPMPTEFENEVVKTIKKRRTSDLREVIRGVLTCPTQNGGDVVEVDGDLPIQDYLDKNVDVMTRIVIRQALMAANGDVKSAEFLMKYGAYTPAQEMSVSVMPTFIDDLPIVDAEVVTKSIESPKSAEKDEEAIEIEVEHE